MFYMFASFGRKNEVFIYQWYIPSASLMISCYSTDLFQFVTGIILLTQVWQMVTF